MAPLMNVLVTRCDFPEEGIKLLQSRCNVEIWTQPGTIPRSSLLEMIKGKNGLYCAPTERINTELLNAAGPNLKVIGTYSVGYDHIDVEACKKRGVLVGHTPGVLTDACAEMTIALLLATSRRVIEACEAVKNGGWDTNALNPLWMCGKSISNSTIGIVGLGRIGFGVAERLKAFKPSKILYSGNKEKPEASSLGFSFVPFHDLLKESDFVICCAPLTPATSRMFDLTAFRKMKKTAVFINSSRGGLVDHEDLYSALTARFILAAGLDVTDPEPIPSDHQLTTLKNCVILPHISSATFETRIAMSVRTAQNVLHGLDGSDMPSPLF